MKLKYKWIENIEICSWLWKELFITENLIAYLRDHSGPKEYFVGTVYDVLKKMSKDVINTVGRRFDYNVIEIVRPNSESPIGSMIVKISLDCYQTIRKFSTLMFSGKINVSLPEYLTERYSMETKICKTSSIDYGDFLITRDHDRPCIYLEFMENEGTLEEYHVYKTIKEK